MGKTQKLVVAMCIDALTSATMLWLSYWFLELVFRKEIAQQMFWLLPTASAITICSFYFFGLYRTVIRFAGARFFLHVIVGSLIVSGLVAAIALASVYGEKVGFPRRVFVLFAITLSVGATSTRLFARNYFDRLRSKNRVPVVIYGAGSGGTQLYSALRYGPSYDPIAFIDDKAELQGRSIHGLRVLSPTKLPRLIESKNIKTILLAMPVLTFEQRAKIITSLEPLNIQIKTTPSLQELISGKASLSDLHTLPIEDLMSRPTVQPNEKLASFCVEQKSVLITGAGGSIGSELCRQIVLRKPKIVVLYEMTESALFYIEQELRARVPQAPCEQITIVPVLGSVLDTSRLKETLLKYKINSVFHAAAYKHVPMLESNPVEGIRNNVLGTKAVVDASLWANVGHLVVVSTDKAVRPTNLMGATKRFAELVVHATAKANTTTKTCMVRFGNVLGSSGSVVPIFKEQIKCGGPVTVTHQDMTRYFMTIPEASQLVMQAGSMANDTEVFVLNMGQPVKIDDLARRMIELSGLTVKDHKNQNGDIEIQYTGLRPGEKMYEELSINDDLEPTTHPKINKALEDHNDKLILQLADQLITAVKEGNQAEVFDVVCRAVPEYTPSEQVRKAMPLVELKTNAHPQVST